MDDTIVESQTVDEEQLSIEELITTHTFSRPINKASISVAALQTNALSLIEMFTQYLAIMRGSTGVIQGLIVSVRQLGTALLQPFWGYLSDTYGRRRFMAIGLLIIAFMGVLLPIMPTAELVLLLVAIQAMFGTMITPSYNAWIGDRTNVGDRARIYGTLSMIGVWSGVVVNLGISFYMDFKDPDLQNVETLRFPMNLAAIFAICGSIAVFFLSAERQVKLKFRSTQSRYKKIITHFRLLNDKFKRLLLVEGTFYFAWAAAWPLFSYAQFDVAKSWLDIAVYALFSSIPAGFSYFYGGKLADRIGYRKILRITRPVLILPPITASLAVYYNSVYFIWMGQLLVGSTLGAATVSINSLIMEYSGENQRASYLSIHLMVVGIIGFLSSTITGLLLQLFSGNSRPSDQVLISLLVGVSIMRFFAQFGYYFLPKPDSIT
ncbi:MAG: MFS transporter [Candidatus Heimdallarchaeota archaeon]|nr:MFS transporter [Candidatus Heimdallarchaeota archaeon]